MCYPQMSLRVVTTHQAPTEGGVGMSQLKCAVRPVLANQWGIMSDPCYPQ